MTTKLILASASPRRKELLRSMHIPFEIVIPDVIEKEDNIGNPQEIVLHNAQLKANDVVKKFPENLVLAADTIVFFNDQILHKPKDLLEARSMLKLLSNNTHYVYTGICLRNQSLNINITHCETSEVRFRLIDDFMIEIYFSKVNPLDKAGAYAIQEHPELIIAGYKGYMSNIMGLPIEFIYCLIRKLKLLD